MESMSTLLVSPVHFNVILCLQWLRHRGHDHGNGEIVDQIVYGRHGSRAARSLGLIFIYSLFCSVMHKFTSVIKDLSYSQDDCFIRRQ